MKKLTIYMIIAFIFILTLSIGFSSFQNRLEIDNVGVVVRYETDIRVTAVSTETSFNAAVTENLNYNIKNISGRITLPDSTSYVIYKMTATNIGNIDQGILKITDLDSSLKFEIVSCNSEDPYKLGIEKIPANGNRRDICIKIMPNGDSYTGDFVATVDFRGYHTVTYTRFEDTTNFQTEIMDGSTTLNANMLEDFEISTGQGIILEKNNDYNFINGVVTFTTGVSSDLFIKSKRIISSTIENGESLMKKMKEFSNNTTMSNAYNYVDTSITAFKRASETEFNAIKNNLTSDNIVSLSGVEITHMWFENGTIYYYTEADVVTVSSGSTARMFAKMSKLEDISGLAYFDTSNVTDMNRMFQDSTSIKDLSPLANWDVSSLTDMTFMFGSNKTTTAGEYMSINSLEPLANWNVSNVTSLNQTFKGCGHLKSLKGLENWDVAKVTTLHQTFNHLGAQSGLDADAYDAIVDWDVRKVTNFQNTLNNTPKDVTKPIFSLRYGIWNTSGTYIPS